MLDTIVNISNLPVVPCHYDDALFEFLVGYKGTRFAQFIGVCNEVPGLEEYFGFLLFKHGDVVKEPRRRSKPCLLILDAPTVSLDAHGSSGVRRQATVH